jgi:hypothetical protein
MIYILTLTVFLNVPGNIGLVTTIPFETEASCTKAAKSAGLRHNLPEGMLRSASGTCVALKEA